MSEVFRKPRFGDAPPVRVELPAGSRHGGAGTAYTHFGCRCEDCRAANTARVMRRQRERAVEIMTDPSLAPHGLASTYSNWGCRCAPCTQANSKRVAPAMRRWRARQKATT